MHSLSFLLEDLFIVQLMTLSKSPWLTRNQCPLAMLHRSLAYKQELSGENIAEPENGKSRVSIVYIRPEKSCI